MSNDGVWRTSDVHVLRATFQSHAISQSQLGSPVPRSPSALRRLEINKKKKRNTVILLCDVAEVSRPRWGGVLLGVGERTVSVVFSHAPFFSAETLVCVRIPNQGALPHI